MKGHYFSGETERGRPDMNGIARRFNQKQSERLGEGKHGIIRRRMCKRYAPSIL